MKSFFKLALLVAVFMLPLLLAAGVPDIAALAEKAVSRNYPDADSVLLYDLEQMTYQTDGTAVSTDEFYQKVLNEAGRRELRRILSSPSIFSAASSKSISVTFPISLP